MLSFNAVFRIYCEENLSFSALKLEAPKGNFVIAQAAKILDNPNISQAVASCWELEVNSNIKPGRDFNLGKIQEQMVEYVSKLYPLMNSCGPERLTYDPIYPTRSVPHDGAQAEFI